MALPLVTERVLRVVREFHEVKEPDAITNDTHFEEDLKFDSLAHTELIMHIEGFFFSFPFQLFSPFLTFPFFTLSFPFPFPFSFPILDEFNIDIPEEDMKQMKTVGDMISYFVAHPTAK